MSQISNKTFSTLSGSEFIAKSGALFGVSTEIIPTPTDINPNLITGDGEQARLMLRLFGWNDPYYVHGSDLEPQANTTAGGDIIDAPATGSPGVYDVVKSTVPFYNYTDAKWVTATGVIRAQGAPPGPKAGLLSEYNSYLFDPVTGFTDDFGNSMTGFQFQRGGDGGVCLGSRNGSMGDDYGMQSIHLPQAQDNSNGLYDSAFDFFEGTEDTPGDRGWTVTWWMTPQWFTGCAWNENVAASANCSGQGPGCDQAWEDAGDTSIMKCLNGRNPEGDFIYRPWMFGNSANFQLGMYHKWEGTDKPCLFFAGPGDNVYVDPNGGTSERNPPYPWDMSYRTGMWTFWAVSYDGRRLANVEDGYVEAMFISVGTPTGSLGNPGGRALASNFFQWSGDGSDSTMYDQELNIDGGTLWDRGAAGESAIVSLAQNYAIGIGSQPNTNGTIHTKTAYWPGMISDFRIYSGQLNTGDVRDIYLGMGTV